MAPVSPGFDRPRVMYKGWRIVAALLLACCGVFALDALLFRTHAYLSILEPESAAGYLELILWREQRAQHGAGDLVLGMGNSRFGLTPKVVDQSPVKRPFVMRSAAVAGTNAQVWYYMLRDLDPTARRYRAIVMGVDDYDDEDQAFAPDNDLSALHYAIGRLRLRDVPEFAGAFHDADLRWQAFRGAVLKGITYQTDIEAFLSHPFKRIAYVRLSHRGFPDWTYDYVELSRTMAGMQIDWPTLKATLPADFNADQRNSVKDYLLREPYPQSGRLAAYRRRWFGKIIDRYRGSRTNIIFVRLPRGPFLRPAELARRSGSSIREFASRPNVILADEHTFDSLEHPEYFRDAAHLNRQGVIRFSLMLADEVTRILGEPEPQRSARR